MNRNRWSMPSIILLVSAIILVIVVIIVSSSSSGPQVSSLENGAGAVGAEALTVTNSVWDKVKDFTSRLFGTRDIDHEYETQKQLIAQLELELQQAQDYQTENERLLDLLNYTQENTNFTYAFSKVIGKQTGAWLDMFVIDKGTKDGIAKDMPVINADGLIGRIYKVGSNWAIVRTIVDSQSAVSVLVERSRDDGVLRGSTDSNSSEPLCNLYFLPYNSSLMPGDKVLTSSLGQVYPEGIAVGEVIEVGRQESTSQFAVIRPYVDFGHIEEVLVVLTHNEAVDVNALLDQPVDQVNEDNGTVAADVTPSANPDSTD